jgi:hypothetical protein
MKEYWTIKNKKSGSWWCRSNYFTSQKHARESYSHRVHALEVAVSIINSCPDIEKDIVIVHVTVKTKPRGTTVGTWAWACEQMVNGFTVWKSAHQTRYWMNITGNMWQMSPEGIQKCAQITSEMIRATSWGRVNP